MLHTLSSISHLQGKSLVRNYCKTWQLLRNPILELRPFAFFLFTSVLFCTSVFVFYLRFAFLFAFRFFFVVVFFLIYYFFAFSFLILRILFILIVCVFFFICVSFFCLRFLFFVCVFFFVCVSASWDTVNMPSIASSKVTMTTILSQRKTGPWKRDFEKTKGTNCIL